MAPSSGKTTHIAPIDEASPRADSPVAEQRCRLVVLSGATKGAVLSLRSAGYDEIQIGKADDNDLALPDTGVSRHHCAIVRDASGWLLKDLGSTNGTFVDDTRVKEAYLRPGATLRLGDALLRFASELTPVAVAPSNASEFGGLVGTSVRMREIFGLFERIAPSDATVLLCGETGTGKGAAARALHARSKHATGPFVVVDCASVPATLIESELFGHERGAFTGADQRRLGALEQAQDGTLFLDELDDLRLDLQPKLLRALEDRAFQRLGSNQVQRFAARVVVASKKSAATLAKGALRSDLYFRVAVFRVELPPLRQRKEDLPLLVDRFALALGHGEPCWTELGSEVRERLAAHHWPGNLRELRNTIERAFALGGGDRPAAEGWDLEGDAGAGSVIPDARYERPFKAAKQELVDRFEREYLLRLLGRSGANIARAAREADLERRHLYRLLAKHDLGGEQAALAAPHGGDGDDGDEET